MLKLVRSPVKFQERASGAWSDRVLSIDGGGTGAATASSARTALGLGTMATQDSSAVSISGGTLAGNGSGLTSLTAANITSGGTLPNLNGSALTSLNATNLASGTVAPARLGTGSGGAVKFLREDSTWQVITLLKHSQPLILNRASNADFEDFTLGTTLDDYTKALIFAEIGDSGKVVNGSANSKCEVTFTSNTNLRIRVDPSGASWFVKGTLYIAEVGS